MFIALPAMILLTHAHTAWAAMGPLQSMKAVRTDTPPVIDGKIDDSCWSKADTATNFTDYELERLAVEQTIVRVLYDDENLYFGFLARDPDPSAIRANLADRDTPFQDDHVGFMIDPFNDERRGFQLSCVRWLHEDDIDNHHRRTAYRDALPRLRWRPPTQRVRPLRGPPCPYSRA